MSGEELRYRLKHYLWLAAHGPDSHAGSIAHLVVETERHGRAEMVDEAREWVRSHDRRA
jgi:hypothetical protein